MIKIKSKKKEKEKKWCITTFFNKLQTAMIWRHTMTQFHPLAVKLTQWEVLRILKGTGEALKNTCTHTPTSMQQSGRWYKTPTIQALTSAWAEYHSSMTGWMREACSHRSAFQDASWSRIPYTDRIKMRQLWLWFTPLGTEFCKIFGMF